VQVQLFNVDCMTHEQKLTLVARAEERLQAARQPWALWSEFRERILAAQEALNISSILDLEDLYPEALEQWKSLMVQGGRAA